jgi:RNA 2',3'-cyclic 3'-phosphodiesterase
MRLFVALDIPHDVRARISGFADRVRPVCPDARWARVEGLHITLKFIGEFPDARVPELTKTLANVKASPFDVRFENTGFFPSPKSPRVFWIGVHAGEQLPQLAEAVSEALAGIGIPREDKAYSPHLTLARAGSRREPGQDLKALAGILTKEMETFGTMTAHEFFLYRSQLGRGGSTYTKLERFELGGSG